MKRRDAGGGGTAVALDVAPVAFVAPRDYLVLAALVVATGLSLATGFSSAQTERSPRADDQAVERIGHASKWRKSIERVCARWSSEVQLPTSESAQISEVSIVLRVGADGTIDIGGKRFRDDELDNLFRAVFARDKMTRVVLKLDKRVAHRRVVNLMERAKAAGLTKLAIGTSGGG